MLPVLDVVLGCSCGQSRNGLFPDGGDSVWSPHLPAALSLILVLKQNVFTSRDRLVKSPFELPEGSHLPIGGHRL